jgi:hypothetical protein
MKTKKNWEIDADIYTLHTLDFLFLHLYSLERMEKVYLILIATMLIDLDHLLVNQFSKQIDVALISTFTYVLCYVDLSSFTFLSKPFR